MRCEEVRENIADYIAEALPETLEVLIEEHARACTTCRSELGGLRTFWADLGQISSPRFDPSATRAAIANAVSSLGHDLVDAPLSKWRIDMRFALKAAAIIVVLASLAAGAGILMSHREESGIHSAPSPRVPRKIDPARTFGSPSAPITLVEYGDYECPPCFSHHSVITELMKQYPDRIRYEYRHFPLTAIHPNALPAAMAAEAAGDQGKFWEMHDLLLSTQASWSRSTQAKEVFITMARRLGLDVEAFARSLESSTVEQRILAQATEARQAGIEAVPTLFINGERHQSSADRPDILHSILLSLIRTRPGTGTN